MTLPPTVLFDAPLSTNTPRNLLPEGRVPVISVPMEFPATTLVLVPSPLRTTPVSLLPEMTFRAAAVAPPIVLPRAPFVTITPKALGSVYRPAASVPMELPVSALPVVPDPVIETPAPELPEITLPVSVLPLAPLRISIPVPLAFGAVPAAVTPMELPMIVADDTPSTRRP